MTQILFSKRANINAVNINNKNPFLISFSLKDYDMMNFLVENGVNVDDEFMLSNILNQNIFIYVLEKMPFINKFKIFIKACSDNNLEIVKHLFRFY